MLFFCAGSIDRYLRWSAENDKDTQWTSHWVSECIRANGDKQQYHNDERLVKLCVLYVGGVMC